MLKLLEKTVFFYNSASNLIDLFWKHIYSCLHENEVTLRKEAICRTIKTVLNYLAKGHI